MLHQFTKNILYKKTITSFIYLLNLCYKHKKTDRSFLLHIFSSAVDEASRVWAPVTGNTNRLHWCLLPLSSSAPKIHSPVQSWRAPARCCCCANIQLGSVAIIRVFCLLWSSVAASTAVAYTWWTQLSSLSLGSGYSWESCLTIISFGARNSQHGFTC